MKRKSQDTKKRGNHKEIVRSKKRRRSGPDDVNSKKGTCRREEKVADIQSNKKGKVYQSRCSPTCFRTAMKGLKSVIAKEQMSRIKDTPFGNWIDMPKLPISSSRIDFILDRFETCSLTVGDDILIPFTAREFSVILGLHHIGQQVDLDLRMNSSFLSRQFEGQVGKAMRKKIYDKLISLASSDVQEEIDDFVRLYILFIFNSIIFSTSNYYTPSFIFPYLDDLTKIFDYAWGEAAFRFLYRGICNRGNATYVDGCTLGLMAWVYERIPVLGKRHKLYVIPRLFQWKDSKIPLDVDKAESLLKSINKTQILSIYPFAEERILLEEVKVYKAGNGPSGGESVDKRLRKQMDDIKRLERKCAELEYELTKSGGRKKLVSDKEQVIKEDDNTEKENENVDLAKEKTETTTDSVDQHLEDVGCHDTEDVPELNIERNAEFVDHLNEPEIEQVLCENSVDGSCDVNDSDCDIKVEVENVVNRIVNEVIGDNSTAENEREISKVVGDAEKTTDFRSSIVDDVRTRIDRKKKLKDPMFVTPPSSAPEIRMKKKLDKSSILIADDANSPMKNDLREYKGRTDYCGHDEATEEERKLLTSYLSREDLNATIWDDGKVVLSAKIFCDFLFGKPVDSEIINVHMRIMQEKSKDYGFEIYCMDTMVQREIFLHLEQRGTIRKLRNSDGYGSRIASLTTQTKDRLQELNEELFTKCKYVIFPVNKNWHWFLLVYVTSERVFKIWNSMHDSFADRFADDLASFLVECVRFQSGFELEGPKVVRENCRDQGASLECGVYTCMWVECLACDTNEIWEYQEDVKPGAYRARVAASILSHTYGLLTCK